MFVKMSLIFLVCGFLPSLGEGQNLIFLDKQFEQQIANRVESGVNPPYPIHLQFKNVNDIVIFVHFFDFLYVHDRRIKTPNVILPIDQVHVRFDKIDRRDVVYALDLEAQIALAKNRSQVHVTSLLEDLGPVFSDDSSLTVVPIREGIEINHSISPPFLPLTSHSRAQSDLLEFVFYNDLTLGDVRDSEVDFARKRLAPGHKLILTGQDDENGKIGAIEFIRRVVRMARVRQDQGEILTDSLVENLAIVANWSKLPELIHSSAYVAQINRQLTLNNSCNGILQE